MDRLWGILIFIDQGLFKMFQTTLFQYDLAQICQSVGVLGFLLYMASFAALQLEWIDGRGLTYSLSNVLAASLVLVSLSVEFNLASALIQISWIAIGLSGAYLRVKERRTVSLFN